jgi:succinate-semialdehyde dehydrogenase/glutarate-semialdehyde dehydrogenase
MSIVDNPLLRARAHLGGDWIDGAAHFEVHDPATGALLARVPDLDDAAIDRAVAAAADAFGPWRARPAAERAGCLARMAAGMRAAERDLAALITAENGKPPAEAIAEVRYATSFLDWFAGEAVRIVDEGVAPARADQRIVVHKEPVGPCALITPWNFPAAMLTRKLGAALAAGCTVVAKPAELTPLTTLGLAQLGVDAGLPPGVLNVVTGDGARIGGRLCRHPQIRKVGFTGSTEVGKIIARAAADDLKRVSLELGGNAPFIVFADADLERATAGAMVAKFRNAGQSCVAANRFLLEAAIAEPLTARLCAAAGEAAYGPLIDDRAVEKVRRLVDDALARGARLRLGAPPEGRRIPPIVLDGVTPAMAIWREEIFGPVIAIARFDGEAEAIALGNDTPYGLVGFVFTRDLARADRVAAALEVGMVGVNEGLVSYAPAPFGGVKQSGYGREGGRTGVDDYLQLKYVVVTMPA